MQVVELMAGVCRSRGPNRLCPTRPDRPGTKRPPPQTGVQAASLRAPANSQARRTSAAGSRSHGGADHTLLSTARNASAGARLLDLEGAGQWRGRERPSGLWKRPERRHGAARLRILRRGRCAGHGSFHSRERPGAAARSTLTARAGLDAVALTANGTGATPSCDPATRVASRFDMAPRV